MTVRPRVLLVEGKEELRVLPELLERAGVEWPASEVPVHISEFDGVEKILAPGAIAAELKASGLEALGILVDADVDPQGRWAQVRERLAQSIPDFPADLDPKGVIHRTGGVRVGVWIMPDNIREGMLETMLLDLRNQNDALTQYVGEATTHAKQLHAPYREVHRAKAELHTWLAWQDPPGLQMHMGVKRKLLMPTEPASGFVTWFCDLFGV